MGVASARSRAPEPLAARLEVRSMCPIRPLTSSCSPKQHKCAAGAGGGRCRPWCGGRRAVPVVASSVSGRLNSHSQQQCATPSSPKASSHSDRRGLDLPLTSLSWRPLQHALNKHIEMRVVAALLAALLVMATAQVRCSLAGGEGGSRPALGRCCRLAGSCRLRLVALNDFSILFCAFPPNRAAASPRTSRP